MLKGIYSAAAGMTSELLHRDVIAENLANINTPGYKTANVVVQSFGEMLISKIRGDETNPLGEINQGSQVIATQTQFQAGAMIATGNPLDMAINGDGFFTIKQPDLDNGMYYTRAGNFSVDAQGFLTTASGGRVQGESGDISIPKEVSQIEMSTSGELFGNGQSLGKIKISQFEDPSVLTRQGANGYSAQQAPKSQADNASVSQGMLEQSNAQAVTELMGSITALRAYEMMQTTVKMQNETLGKVINEVGRTS